MSPTPSPPPEAKPIKKKVFMFKRANFGGSSKSAGNDELSFFSRNRENYIGVVEPREEEKPEVRSKNAHRQDDDNNDDDGAGSPPKRAKRRSTVADNNDEDSGEEISSTQGRHESIRQRYKHAIALSDSDSQLLKQEKTGKTGNKSMPMSSKSRARDTSLTPPPVLYAETTYPKTNPRRTTSANPPPASTRDYRNISSPSLPVVRTSGAISDDDDDVVLTNVTATAKTPIDEDDEMLAAIERRARERVAAAARAFGSGSNPLSSPPPDAIVSILVTSEIEGTRPLVVRRRLRQSLKVVRETWCTRQKFTEEEAADVFLTWKGNKVFDHNTCHGIGIGVDELGNLADQGGTRDNNVHFEAMTAEMLAEREREREMQYETGALPEAEEEQEEVAASMRLTLKSKGYEDFKLKVRPDTKIFKIVSSFRDARSVDQSRDITLGFDGDTLDPDETVGDTELEDTFCIDVYIN